MATPFIASNISGDTVKMAAALYGVITLGQMTPFSTHWVIWYCGG
jgi:hypothetical protein